MGTKVEIRQKGQENWMEIGTEILPGMPPASFSDYTNSTISIILFGCNDDGLSSFIRRSNRGFDIESEDGLREVATLDIEDLANITSESEPFEIELQPERLQSPIQARFTHV